VGRLVEHWIDNDCGEWQMAGLVETDEPEREPGVDEEAAPGWTPKAA
jgi:hypothetical protein